MYDNARRDDELADFTNQLLAGDNPVDPTGQEALASMVRRIHDVVDPADRPDPAFRMQLTQRLKMEWDLQNQRLPHWWQNRRMQRLLGVLAASVALVLAAVVLFTAYDGDASKPIEGSALGSAAGIVIVALVAVGIVSLVVMFRRYQ